MAENLLFDVDERGVATLTMNRPEVRNAFDDGLIGAMTDQLMAIRERDDIRVVVITGAGECFSAGADMNWMRSMADASEEENLEDALRLADLMSTLHDMGKPTVARVNGHAFGGGVGLVACCDIAVAAQEARFSFSEVRLGLVPAVISPYVLDAIGVRHGRRFFLSGEVMGAKKARRVGLVHEITRPRPPQRGHRGSGLDVAPGRAGGHPGVQGADRDGGRSLPVRRPRVAPTYGRSHRAAARRRRGPGRPARFPRKAPAGLGRRQRMIRRLLIANRGEIACRIIRSAQRLGIRTVAVYSEADAGARHVRLADEAVAIGPASAAESYLSIARILAAAEETGADAVHPGYGFLAENADFAQACHDSGLFFVGPSPETIRDMGSKRRAREIMQAAGVPVVPGYEGEDQADATLAAAAAEIGYPLMIKASAGGGGKGMRVVHDADAFGEALAGARREAAAAFADDRMILERLIERPRHVEFQIFADAHGHVVHLFERECSIQRRYQKIIEETPAPTLEPALREQMAAAAVAAARAVDYRNAGTVEFLLDGDRFYFMEMNTRLQVEHPITEAVTGLDLVEWQLRVTAGDPLPQDQSEIASHGHAMEARIYAENPFEGFLPSTGRIGRFAHPPTGPDLRLDAGVEDGDEVTIHYDPMIAKLIVWGKDRAAAVAALRRALSRTLITGPTTNLALLRGIAAHEDFAAAAMDTGYLDRHLAEVIDALPRPHEVALAAAAAARLQEGARTAQRTGDPCSPWDAFDGWRPGGGGVRFAFGDDCGGRYEVHARGDRGRYTMTIGDRRHEVEANPAGRERLDLRVDDSDHSATVVTFPDGVKVGLDTGGFELSHLPLYAASASGEEDAHPGAPMPGRIVAVYVAEGDAVEPGQALLVLEGMKMEFTLTAPTGGVISRLRCAEGDMVEAETPLVDIEAPSTPSDRGTEPATS